MTLLHLLLFVIEYDVLLESIINCCCLGEEWGFGGTKFPPLHRSANVNAGEVGTGKWISAVQAWLEAQPDKSVHCVPTGSLTNIAILFTVIPKLMHVCGQYAKVKCESSTDYEALTIFCCEIVGEIE